MSTQKTSRRPKRAHKCESMGEVVNAQREALKYTIREAKASEKMRQQMLREAPSSERIEELKYRHTRERLKDQEKITRLIDDIGHVEAAGNRESLNAEIGPTKLKTMHMDRFETSKLHNCYKDIFNKFESIDIRANQVATERYNEYKEKKTLDLLNSKRAVLGKLVAIQKHALHGKTFNGNSSRTQSDTSQRNSARSSSSDTSSVASYATFNTAATSTKIKAQQQKIGKNVPRLF
jgi:hypothetical protein